MCAAGVWIAAAGWLTRDLPPFRWTWLTLLVAFVIAIAGTVALAMVFARQFLMFGPPEYAATIFFLYAAAIALARRAHLRALGMVLIGLLLSTAGIDVVTGRMRFTFGSEAFLDGFNFLVVAPGIIVIGEALLCLASPQRWFSSYRWIAPAATLARGPKWPLLLRALSALAIAASLWLAWEVHHSAWDVLFALCFGVFGAVCMMLGWNRAALCFALYYGTQLEQSLRQSLILTKGNFSVFLERPFSQLHIALAALLLAAAFALWLFHVRRQKL
jgi:TctA family transporter